MTNRMNFIGGPTVCCRANGGRTWDVGNTIVLGEPARLTA